MAEAERFSIVVPDQGQRLAYARATSWAFAVPEHEAVESMVRREPADHRVVLDEERAVGGLFLHRMGQYFGGWRVPCLGVGGVAIEPHARGRGAAGALMWAVLREAHDEGWALSALYPATQPLYRKLGYEQAVRHTRLRIPVASLPPGRGPCPVEHISGEERLETLKALYFSVARRTPGHLERSDAIWDRVLVQPGRSPRVYLFTEQGAPSGYVVLDERRRAGFAYDLEVRDLVVTSRASLKTAVGFLASHGSLGRDVVLPVPASDPLALSVVEQRFRVAEDWRQLLRVVDVPGALAARGWPRALSAELDLEVSDPLLEGNAGPWRLSIEAGEARVERGGAGAVKLDVRALAALYSGYAHPADLAFANLLKAPARALDEVARVFASPAPSCRDFF